MICECGKDHADPDDQHRASCAIWSEPWPRPSYDQLRAALARVTAERDRCADVLRFQLDHYPCPGDGTGIHADAARNRPGRCPEESDDPEEWCISAKARKALAGITGQHNAREKGE